jgi:hypothetical protein
MGTQCLLTGTGFLQGDKNVLKLYFTDGAQRHKFTANHPLAYLKGANAMIYKLYLNKVVFFKGTYTP